MQEERVFKCFDPYMLAEIVNEKAKIKDEEECDYKCDYLRFQLGEYGQEIEHECLLFDSPELKTDGNHGFVEKVFRCEECKKNFKIISSEVIGEEKNG